MHELSQYRDHRQARARDYFATPLAYVFIVIFLVLSGVFTFYLGGFFERGQADLARSSTSTPGCTCSWCRRIAMRLWAEERKTRHHRAADDAADHALARRCCGKFLAAWAFAGVALLLTFPMGSPSTTWASPTTARSSPAISAAG